MSTHPGGPNGSKGVPNVPGVRNEKMFTSNDFDPLKKTVVCESDVIGGRREGGRVEDPFDELVSRQERKESKIDR